MWEYDAPADPTQPAGTRRGELERALRVLRRRWWLIALCTVLVAGSALGFSLLQSKQYSASAELLFRDAQLDQKLTGSTAVAPSADPAREAATNVKLVSLQVVAQRTARALPGRLSAGAIQSKVSVNAEGQSNVVSVTATDPRPAVAAQLANTFAEQFIQFRRDADRSNIAGAQQLVQSQLDSLTPAERNSASARSLQDRAQQLGVLASLQTGNAELVQPARPPASPSSPRTARNVAIGLVLGLLLGVGLAFLFERLDRRIRDVGELEEVYGLPVLASVPESKALAASSGREGAGSFGTELPFREAEIFRMLRTRLRYFNVDRQLRTLIITSVAPGEGKSTVSRYLASMAAGSSPGRVLLLEADLRRPRLAREHGLSSMPGLAEALTHGVGLDEVIQHVPLGDPDNGADGGKTLDVIVAGANPPNAAELLESAKMGELLNELSAIYDLIVIDTPPTAAVADAIPLMTRVSGVVVVSAVGWALRDAAAHLREQLQRLGAPMLGVVANRVKSRRGADHYGYGDTDTDAPAYIPTPAPEGLERERTAS
jgi:succinoglycan biosynthesis transport protein ExoP